ncbi:MAG: TIGR03986 family CRISPR-associated RAMP protein [Clostridia bacterium]|nr:TIGR03986 family CRISPR-associated RAMP protein [Clostridia bacterium]
MNDRIVRAPYNFVPFSDSPFIRYLSTEELPSHNFLDERLLSGEIKVTIRANTPIFVGKDQSNPDVNDHFYRTPSGTMAIPGSTVKGLLRQNMQMLGLGWVEPGEDFDDYQIYFREMASSATGVKAKLKQYYKEVLQIRTVEKNAVPENVRAGFLYNHNGKYVIYPTSFPYSVSRAANSRLTRPFQKKDEPRFEQAHTDDVYYQVEDGRITALLPRDKTTTCPPGMLPGVLMFTGKPVSRIPNSAYVFPMYPENTQPISISEDDIHSYRLDLEKRRPILKSQNFSFWNLPANGMQKPVFYVLYQDQVFFGMSRYLRIGFPCKLSTGLPEGQKRDPDSPIPLDYSRSVFGYSYGLSNSYASRVSVSDFLLQGVPAELSPVAPKLMGAKLSYFPGYTIDGKPYTEPDFQLRGYKQYWLKETVQETDGAKGIGFFPLKADSQFEGVIRYKNLHPDELGLLLLCIRLKSNCYQLLGKAKPYGYGRCTVTITDLIVHPLSRLYEDFSYTPASNLNQVEDYIQAFYKKMEASGIEPEASEVWEAFFAMHQTLFTDITPVSYMPLSGFNDAKTPLPTVAGVLKGESETVKIKAGMTLSGVVNNVVEFGIFLTLAPGVQGLLHNSYIPQELKDTVQKGDTLTVTVTQVIYDEKKKKDRIVLSLPETNEA